MQVNLRKATSMNIQINFFFFTVRLLNSPAATSTCFTSLNYTGWIVQKIDQYNQIKQFLEEKSKK